MSVERRGSAQWSGTLFEGSGTFSLDNGGITDVPVTWRARAEESEGKTSPEELLAAAHASCFTMALSGALAKNDTPAENLEAAATVTFGKTDAGFRVLKSHIDLTAVIPGIDDETFQELATGAKDGCPISSALMGNVEISLSAYLK